MFRHLFRAAMLVFVPASCAVLLAQPVCSLQTVVGTWAASSTGTVYATLPGNPEPMAVPGAAMAIVSIGYDGRFSVVLSGVFAGSPAGDSGVTATGSATVNSDCTGAFRATTSQGWKMAEQFTILNQGDEVWTFAPQGMAAKPAVWQCRWVRISHQPLDAMSNCPGDLLRGQWVGSYSGFMVLAGKPAPVAAATSYVGSIDFHGNLTGKFTTSVAGNVSAGQYVGSITALNSDCTGKWTWALKSTSGPAVSGSGIEKFIVVNGGNEIWALTLQGVQGSPIGLTRYQRISRVPSN